MFRSNLEILKHHGLYIFNWIDPWSETPDVEIIKSSTIFLRVAKWPKISLDIWATFVRKFVAKNFKKSPNLVTLPIVEKQNFSYKAARTEPKK